MLCARFAGADKDVVVPWCRVEDLLPSRHAEELRSRQTDLSNAYWDEVDREGMAKEGRQPEVEELQSAEEECLVLREGKVVEVPPGFQAAPATRPRSWPSMLDGAAPSPRRMRSNTRHSGADVG